MGNKFWPCLHVKWQLEVKTMELLDQVLAEEEKFVESLTRKLDKPSKYFCNNTWSGYDNVFQVYFQLSCILHLSLPTETRRSHGS